MCQAVAAWHACQEMCRALCEISARILRGGGILLLGPFPTRYCQYFSMGLSGFRRGRAHSWQAFLGANKRVPHGPHTTKAVPQATRSFSVHTVPSLKRAPCLQHLRSSCWVGSRNAKNTVRGSGQGWGTRHSDWDPSPKDPLFGDTCKHPAAPDNAACAKHFRKLLGMFDGKPYRQASQVSEK